MANAQLSRLEHRCIVRVGGDDRAKYLQGILTNDIALLDRDDTGLIYACLLTPQGKFLHEFFICKDGDSYLLDTEKDRLDDLLRLLKLYKIRTRVDIEKMDDYQIVARFDEQTTLTSGPSHIAHADPRTPKAGTRIITKTPSVDLAALDGSESDLAAYDYHRIALGLPDGSRDMVPEQTTMAEARIDTLGGVSFTKGCYVGQELTARMHHRGLAKKHIVPMQSLTGIFPKAGEDIPAADGKSAGHARSSARDVGMALIRDEMKPEIERAGRFRFIP